MKEMPQARADLHVHTSYSAWRHLRLIHTRDSYLEPRDAYEAAFRAGMDFAAITDHDAIEGALRLRGSKGVDPERVIVGEEVECRFPETGQWVHVSAFGLDEAEHARLQALRSDVRELCAFCREERLLFVLNHPFQSFRWQKPIQAYIEDVLSLFTHVEGLNGGVHSLQNRAVSALCACAAEHGRTLVQVGGSDAHTRRRVGSAYTQARAATAAEFLAEIEAGRCAVGGTTDSTVGLLRDVYTNVGRYYVNLCTGRGEAPSAAAYAVDAAVASLCLPAAIGGLPFASVLASQAVQKAVSRMALDSLHQMDWSRGTLPART